MCTVLDGPRSAATADETIRTGILTVAKSVAMSGAVCPGVPSFAISAAAAPAASAFRAFWVKGQSPRFMSAIAPFGNPPKSEAEQPLEVEVL